MAGRGGRPGDAAADTPRRPGTATGSRLIGGFVLSGAVAAVFAAWSPAGLAQAPRTAEQAAVQREAAPAAAKPWPPDAETLEKRRLEAEALPLFQSLEPLEITITADFKAVQRDRDVNSRKLYPGTLSIAAGGVAGPPIPIRLRTRGHVRRSRTLCSFAPLRLKFDKADVKGTVFEGQDALKLATHCQSPSVFRQYTLKEYLANQLHALLTPRAVRSRLAEVTYAEPGGKSPYTKLAIIFEDDDDVAKRVEAQVVERQGLMFKDVDLPSLVFMSLFQYMIGNTDYSILKLHNVRILLDARNRYIAMPYDFDYSGLVNAHYAAVGKGLELESVEERMYRGPCVAAATYQMELGVFRAKREAVLGMPAAIPGLDDGHRKRAEKYLAEFYEIVGDPDRFSRVFLKGCRAVGGV